MTRLSKLLGVFLALTASAFAHTPVLYFPTNDTTKQTIDFSWDTAPDDYVYYLQVTSGI